MRRSRNIVAAICVLAVVAQSRAQSIEIVDDLPGAFIDISVGSTALNLGDDDEILISGSGIGNSVFPTNFVAVGNNGGLGFRNSSLTDLSPLNAAIPSGSAFVGGQALLAFWDDIDDKNGDVYSMQLTDRLIVQWDGRNIDGTGDTVTFQIQIFEQSAVGSDNIVAQFLYADIEQTRPAGGVSTTIGYQDGGVGLGDFQWSFDTANAVADGTVLSVVLTPEPSSLLMLTVCAAGVFTNRRTLVRRRY